MYIELSVRDVLLNSFVHPLKCSKLFIALKLKQYIKRREKHTFSKLAVLVIVLALFFIFWFYIEFNQLVLFLFEEHFKCYKASIF